MFGKTSCFDTNFCWLLELDSRLDTINPSSAPPFSQISSVPLGARWIKSGNTKVAYNIKMLCLDCTVYMFQQTEVRLEEPPTTLKCSGLHPQGKPAPVVQPPTSISPPSQSEDPLETKGLEELIKFINGTEEDDKKPLSAKAAKRARQKQRKVNTCNLLKTKVSLVVYIMKVFLDVML